MNGWEHVRAMTVYLLKVAASLGLGLFEGFVLSMMWRWFVVPKFGLPPIGAVEGMGLGLLVALPLSNWRRAFDRMQKTSRMSHAEQESEGRADWEFIMFRGLFAYPFLLLIGYVIHLFL